MNGVGDLARLRDTATAVAREAGELALGYFGQGVAVSVKADGSPVTRADLEAEALIRRRLAQAFPDHGILGEEHGGGLDADRPTWVLDPIDATKNFVRGLPMWATLLALVVDGEPVVGVVEAPAMGERWDAARGLGARRDGAPVRVSGVARLADAHVLHGGLDWFRADPRRWALLGEVAERAWRTRGFGDWWMHVLVASGAADVAFEADVKPWDIAAVQCIVAEAGGRMTAWDGGDPLTAGEALTTNGHLHPQLVELLSRS